MIIKKKHQPQKKKRDLQLHDAWFTKNRLHHAKRRGCIESWKHKRQICMAQVLFLHLISREKWFFFKTLFFFSLSEPSHLHILSFCFSRFFFMKNNFYSYFFVGVFFLRQKYWDIPLKRLIEMSLLKNIIFSPSSLPLLFPFLSFCVTNLWIESNPAVKKIVCPFHTHFLW